MADKLIDVVDSPISDPDRVMMSERSIRIVMRDGTRLSSDLYLPRNCKPPYPVILIRTPYGKHRYRPGRRVPRAWARYHQLIAVFVEAGYAVAIQDKRGKYESEGEYYAYTHDAADGYDTIEWLGTRPWSNGRVGMYGCSYSGDVQIIAAQTRPPHLRCIIPQGATGGGRYPYIAVRLGGARELAMSLGWWRSYGASLNLQVPDRATAEDWATLADYFDASAQIPPLSHDALRSLWSSLPVIDMMRRSGAPRTAWEELMSRELDDPWWVRQFDHVGEDCRIDVPALFENSWYDFGVAETLQMFNRFRRIAASPTSQEHQYVVISPMCHCESADATETTFVGERNVGDARFDYLGLHLRWFDHWLKGDDNDVLDRPKVQYFLMGRNEWRHASTWPVPGTVLQRFYLHSGGRANSLFGDGQLSIVPPHDEPCDRFIYDPATPVPSLGGPLCCTGTPEQMEGALDQRGLEARHDVLVYTSEPVERGIEVTGDLRVVLSVSSSATDTDFTAKLVDVDPDGRAYNLQEGVLRVRYREGFDRPTRMTPGAIYEISIDLQATSNWFAPGHRIRLEVSSSNFPRFDRNLNTGGNNYDETAWIVAANEVHHDADHPSYLLLPVVPN